MIVFPAIDLKQGQVVRLAEGDMDRATVYGDNPAAQAMLFAEAGSQFLHVVDLDGSFAGRAENREAVEAILEVFPGHVQLGGGIRTPEAVAGWFDLGVSRVVMGTAALKDPQFVKDMAKEFPGGIVVAVDARDGMVATEGWAEVSDVSIVDMARRFEDAGVASLLFTDIGRDGLLKGVNIDATVDLARRTDLPVIASGGVKGLDDIRLLALHAKDGIEGVITGRALYDGRLDLAAAIQFAEREEVNENRLMAVLAFVIFVPAAIFAFRDWREGKARLMLFSRARNPILTTKAADPRKFALYTAFNVALCGVVAIFAVLLFFKPE